jgi:hypothetical protein
MRYTEKLVIANEALQAPPRLIEELQKAPFFRSLHNGMQERTPCTFHFGAFCDRETTF